MQMLLDWLLPARCGGCRALGSWFCPGCRALIRPLREPICARCGRELEVRGEACRCRRRLRALEAVRSAAAYEGPLERAIHRLKYQGRRPLARVLAELLVERFEPFLRPEALLLPVPLHPRRRRQRGFNQSQLLVEELRRAWSVGHARGRLVRCRDTRSQVGLDRAQRRRNVEGAFRWRGPDLEGRPVLLIDDVITTCATVEACARALLEAGAGDVRALSVARVSA
ncbi:MAG: ComF family protein [Candidatus Dormibacteraeota bacterium]|nr:ComF family protein [Candidatus Dormibacteraeota bacterium]